MGVAIINAIGMIVAAIAGAVVQYLIHRHEQKRREDAVQDDSALDKLNADESPETLVDEPDCAQPKHFERYSINGVGNYKKNRLVLEVIRQYVQKNPAVTYEGLQQVFPKTVRGLKRDDSFWGCFNLQKDADQLCRDTGKRRHFLKKDELIRLADGNTIAVSTQWGSGNIPLFIANAVKLGFDIKTVA